MKTLDENNYSFSKKLHRRCLVGSWIYLEFWILEHSEYTGVLSITEWWMCQSSEYACGSEYDKILDIAWS